ncbi:MAG: DUF2844 domain-containing protein [Acidobacteria bacterium]|nr:DUF2844 domain-containing protein [Acidobacteriota bacterium]
MPLKTCGFVSLAVAMLCSAAAASLGDNVASVESDSRRMHAAVHVTHYAGYDVHELQYGAGAVVREYASPAGIVFGVAWQGPAMPDMKQVLGPYFAQFQQAAQARHARRGPLSVEEPGLVVRVSGHMRSFSGQAYVPQFMPHGIRGPDVR